MSTSSFEHLGRERKARAIARTIWRHLPPETRTNPELPAGVADVPQEERDSFARVAGQKKPSEETWAVVVRMLAEMVEDERHWLGQTEEPQARVS